MDDEDKQMEITRLIVDTHMDFKGKDTGHILSVKTSLR